MKRRAGTRVAEQFDRVLHNYIILFQMGNPEGTRWLHWIKYIYFAIRISILFYFLSKLADFLGFCINLCVYTLSVHFPHIVSQKILVFVSKWSVFVNNLVKINIFWQFSVKILLNFRNSKARVPQWEPGSLPPDSYVYLWPSAFLIY